jgi:hypothetical protein
MKFFQLVYSHFIIESSIPAPPPPPMPSMEGMEPPPPPPPPPAVESESSGASANILKLKDDPLYAKYVKYNGTSYSTLCLVTSQCNGWDCLRAQFGRK